MSALRFGSWPMFNGKKVVLEDDPRLGGGVPTRVAGDAVFTAPDDTQVLGFVPIKVDGTLVINGTMVMM